MKKVERIAFLFVILILPLLAMSCPNNSAADVALYGNCILNGEKLSVEAIGSGHRFEEMPDRPFIFVSWKSDLDPVSGSCYHPVFSPDVYPNNENVYEIIHFSSWEIVNGVKLTKEKGLDLIQDSLFTFTYYPKTGDPISVDSSNVAWNTAINNFTVDFTKGTFTVE